ncbi:MAG: class I SAM-dependent RNA methyltransferase, partial [Cytophagaceae bacterium]|nr:class I SAM-dependent RNA methyltransferase [Gemmatimonadaceae bacterium]
TVPGDHVAVALRRHKRFADGRLQQVLTPGASRVVAPCVHYDGDRCGGCQLQHMSYEAQLEAKRDIVVQAFRRIGRREVTVDEIVASPAPWAYRNKLTLTLRRGPAGWYAGLRAYDNPDAVFALRECPITSERVLSAWGEVMAASDLLPAADELRGMVRDTGEGAAFHLSGGTSWAEAATFASRCASLRSIRWEDQRGEVRTLRVDASGATSAASFAQVNTQLAGALHDRAASLATSRDPVRVIDAYGGSGALAGRMRAAGREVILIELDGDATRLARQELGGEVRVVTARVEERLTRELPADAVVLNPPRTGVDAAVCHALEQATPRAATIVYVSCDPATLARDVARLPSWRVASLTLFDMFPQTAHVETVCELVPEGA